MNTQESAIKPMVSIFLPYNNDEKFLADAINSILKQNYRDFELLLFDNASTDNSRAIARSFKDKRIIHVRAEKSLPAPCGLNLLRVLKDLKGKYVQLFCAENIMMPNCLDVALRYLEENIEADVLISDAFLLNKEGILKAETWFEKRRRLHKDARVFCQKNVLKLLFNRRSPILYPANLIRKKSLEEIEPAKTFTYLFEDHLWLSFLVQNGRIDFLDKPLIGHREYREKNPKGALNKVVRAEVSELYNIFYKIKDVELIKHLCPTSPYIKDLKASEVEFFPFVLAHYMLSRTNGFCINEFANCHESISLNGYLLIQKYMQDEPLRQKLYERFGFNIIKFTRLYTNETATTDRMKDGVEEIYQKAPFELNIFETTRLLLKKMGDIIAFRCEKNRKTFKKNIFLTGSGGFIGGSLREYLEDDYNLLAPRSFELDLCDKKEVEKFFRKYHIDVIIHCATVGGERGVQDANDVVVKNMAMLKNIIAARKKWAKKAKIIAFGSGAMYDKTRELQKVDEATVGKFVPNDLYGISKMLIADEVKKVKNAVCLNIFACYGAGEKASRFPTYAILRNIKKEPVIIEKNVLFDYLYVEDMQKIVAHFVENKTKEKVINITPTKSVSLVEIAKMVNEVSGYNSEIIIKERTLGDEYTGSNKRLLKEMGQVDFTDYKAGIKKLYEHLKKSARTKEEAIKRV